MLQLGWKGYRGHRNLGNLVDNLVDECSDIEEVYIVLSMAYSEFSRHGSTLQGFVRYTPNNRSEWEKDTYFSHSQLFLFCHPSRLIGRSLDQEFTLISITGETHDESRGDGGAQREGGERLHDCLIWSEN